MPTTPLHNLSDPDLLEEFRAAKFNVDTACYADRAEDERRQVDDWKPRMEAALAEMARRSLKVAA